MPVGCAPIANSIALVSHSASRRAFPAALSLARIVSLSWLSEQLGLRKHLHQKGPALVERAGLRFRNSCTSRSMTSSGRDLP